MSDELTPAAETSLINTLVSKCETQQSRIAYLEKEAEVLRSALYEANKGTRLYPGDPGRWFHLLFP